MKKRLTILSVLFVILGMLTAADAFAAGYTIHFSGRTFADGVQAGGIPVKIWTKFIKEGGDGESFEYLETGPYSTFSDAAGFYSLTITQNNARYEPYSAWIIAEVNNYLLPPHAYLQYCYAKRLVSMTYGENRRHLYLTCSPIIFNNPDSNY